MKSTYGELVPGDLLITRGVLGRHDDWYQLILTAVRGRLDIMTMRFDSNRKTLVWMAFDVLDVSWSRDRRLSPSTEIISLKLEDNRR
jgi:hypothetical protein